MGNKLEKWIKWLKVNQEEIEQLVLSKDIFWSTNGLIKSNKALHIPSAFYQYLGDTYISHSIIGIRRQIKKDKQSISMRGLLEDIANNPNLISRDYYRCLYSIGFELNESVNQGFEKFCLTSGMREVLEEYVQDDIKSDIDELEKLAKNCEDLVDKRIAHRDKNPPKILPKFKEVDQVIDKLDNLYVKYHLLIHAEYMDTLLPTYQYDWKKIFDVPWRL